MTVGELKELISETFGIKKGKKLKRDLRVPRETKVSVYLNNSIKYLNLSRKRPAQTTCFSAVSLAFSN